jgi:SpoVK/Ycf46/Vps4 family AAA+-type ATPase
MPVELSPEDLERLLDALRGMTANQARQVVAYAALADGRFSADNIRTVQERKARLLQESSALEYFPAEDNPFELGGFQRLKAWLERAQVGFAPEARDLNLPPPRGVLLVGVQGCGKSLAAKVIARSWGLPLLKLDAGLLYDKYLGESEKNFRRAVEVAEAMAPCLLWVDEIEKGFSPTGPGESDGGVSRRLFGALLTWMQERRTDVFLVATSNDVFGLPPELLRKGRFDEVFFVDLPDPEDRQAIFRIHLRRHKQNPDRVDLEQLTEATDGFSGAEIEQAVIAGLYRALHERKPLDTSLLLREIEGTVPLSVSRREDVTRLRELARERFVPVK